MIVFVNGRGVRFDRVINTSIVKGHVCELSIDSF